MAVRFMNVILCVLIGLILVLSFMDKTRLVMLLGNITCVAIVVGVTIWAFLLAGII